MKTIQATDDLVIELWPAGEAADRPALRLRSLGAAAEGDRQAVVIYLDEVRLLVGALVDAALELADVTVLGAREGSEP